MNITNEDLTKEIALKELIELSDVEGTGTIDQNVIDDCVKDSLSFVSSFVIMPTNPTALLKDIVIDLSILELKKRQNFPKKSLKETQERCESLLLKMASKKIPIDITTQKHTAPVQKQRAFRHNSKRLNLKGL